MPFDSAQFAIGRARLDDYMDCVRFLNERGQDLLRSGPIPVHESLHQRRLMEQTRTQISLIRQISTGRVVAVALIMISYDWRKGVGSVEYVLADEDFRGNGLGRALMEHLLEGVRGVYPKIKVIRLVSEPEHVAARALYESLGFTLVEGSDRHYEQDFLAYLRRKDAA